MHLKTLHGILFPRMHYAPCEISSSNALVNWRDFGKNCMYMYASIYFRGVTIRVFVLNCSVLGFRFSTHYKPNDSLD